MDPNVTLAKIRTHVWEAKERKGDHGVYAWNLEQACHLFEDLDAWVSAGGFLPHAWESAPLTSGYRYLSPSEREEQGYARAQ